MTLTIDPIWIPILISAICAAVAFWPRKRGDPGQMGLAVLWDGFEASLTLALCTIVALIGWIVYLALT